MRCAEIHPLLAARRELSWGQERMVREHLTSCAACAARWAREERALQGLRAVPTPDLSAAPAPGQRLRDALERGRRPRSYARPLALAAALCGLAALLLLNVRLPWGQPGTAGQPAPTSSTTQTPGAPTTPYAVAPSATLPADTTPPAMAPSATIPAGYTPLPTQTRPPTPAIQPIAIDPDATPAPLAFNNASMEGGESTVVVLDPASGQELLTVENAFLWDWRPQIGHLIFGRCLTEIRGPTDRCQEYDLFLVNLNDQPPRPETRLTNTGAEKQNVVALNNDLVIYTTCSGSGCQLLDVIALDIESKQTQDFGLKVPLYSRLAISSKTADLAFHGCPGGEPSCTTYALYVQPNDESPVRKLADNVPIGHVPAWAPDGTRLAFSAERDGQGEIFTVNADGSGLTQLTSGPGDKSGPAWSPAGTHIAYSVRITDSATLSGYDSDIYVMGADGSSPTRLTDTAGQERDPAWSPDGQFIAFIGDQPPGSPMDFRLYLMRADGAEQRMLSDRLSLSPLWARW